jgi:TrmH family RNA methyltransferase
MPKEILLSDKSDKLKWFKALVDQKDERYKNKLCLVFGKKLVHELDNVVAFITTDQAKDDPVFQNKDTYILSESAFKKLSPVVTPEPYAAVVPLPDLSFPSSILTGIFVLDRLQDPGNIGTLYRTALGLGFEGLILLKPCMDPYHEKIIRASKGACLKLPTLVIEKDDLKKVLENLGLKAYIAELNGQALSKVKHEGPFALILGNESEGVSEQLHELGTLVHIEQKSLESYNVAIAGAIIGYTLTCHKESS